ncbi:transposase [Castellaniella sp.]|uniref:transposase n=1 Tax=Castellaniella sp. TaxID=1955812 RepID=UPI0039C862CC
MGSSTGYRNPPRRRFSREFKREVVEMLIEEAATVAEVAREYDLHPNQLFRWRSE